MGHEPPILLPVFPKEKHILRDGCGGSRTDDSRINILSGMLTAILRYKMTEFPYEVTNPYTEIYRIEIAKSEPMKSEEKEQ